MFVKTEAVVWNAISVISLYDWEELTILFNKHFSLFWYTGEKDCLM